jgi:hypothetical protein
MHVQILKNKWFTRFAKAEGISDEKLCEAVKDAERGLIDADYGGGVIKQRIARENAGKSGGYRTIVLYRIGRRAFFVYGFSKKDRENLDDYEVREYKKSARIILNYSDEELDKHITNGVFQTVACHEKDQDI